MARIERRLVQYGKTRKAFFHAAGIDASTWSRWKKTGQRPMLDTWLKVVAAADRIAEPDRREAAR